MYTRRVVLLAIVVMFATGPAMASAQEQDYKYAATPGTKPEGKAEQTRIVRYYLMPEAPLIDQGGLQVYLHEELRQPGPVLINFIFTTCPGVCPILSAIFTRTAVLLGEDLEQTRFWSISLDPDFDTPERLSKYGAQYHAPGQWRFFTGQPMAVKTIRKAFDADSDNKMAHRSLVLLRLKDDVWVRFEGEIKPDRLVAEIRSTLISGR